MSAARQCDSCGSVGHAPYETWLRVVSRKTEKVEREDGFFGRPSSRDEPVIELDVCSFECLPDLAFKRSEQFLAARSAA